MFNELCGTRIAPTASAQTLLARMAIKIDFMTWIDDDLDLAD